MKTNQYAIVVAVVSVVSLFATSPSVACSFVRKTMTLPQVRQKARDNFRRASAVIDAEVVAPMAFGRDWKPGLIPLAYLKPTKIWKGRVQHDNVPIIYLTSCDIGLRTKGERLRLLLIGEGVFRADQSLNGGGSGDLSTYNAEIDRLVGKRRSPALARFPGDSQLPARRGNVR
ncbi:MAG: hypothetical protein EOO77_12565 [Oxalobacteraceae bacterium]|nr:MAG: hypothetical protein EOO77_12565 [Oxalobacteraceae bacterium]